MEKIIKFIKHTKLGQWFKRTRFCIFLKQSQGDWRYPFMVIAWQLSRLIVPRKKIIIENVSFTLPCTNWITHFRWYLFNIKEQEVRYYIDHYVREGDVFFDIGANIGVFSVYAGKLFKDISIYCFEPEYSNLSILKENIICNALADRTKIFSVAVGDFNGPTNLHIQDFTPGAAEHSEEKEPIAKTREGHKVVWSEGIMSATIDSLCEHLDVIPNCIKIDTDSNEDKVLRGAEKMLSNKCLRSIILEMPNDREKVFYCHERLSQAGFKAHWADTEKTRNEIWVRT